VRETVPELSVVMPVYREAEIIASVIDAWSGMLEGHGIDFELLVYDDGSPDETLEILRAREQTLPRLRVTNHSNRGHGPTILRGYREARGSWVFQVDSDDEIAPDPFPDLWSQRESYDLLLACRGGPQPLARRVVSGVSRFTVRLLFGQGVTDVNAPYRLMRRSWLEGALARVPQGTFAPNVILSGLAIHDGVRIFEHPVARRARKTGRPSLGSFTLWTRALQSFGQTLRAAWSVRTRRCRKCPS
jgi:hypothetical protein